jgi:aspartate dehydrogenase
MTHEHTVAIAGLGSIGRSLAKKIDAGLPGIRLTAAASRDADKARAFLGELRGRVALVPLGTLHEHADLVIECAPSNLLPQIAAPTLRAGKHMMVLSAGALLAHDSLIALAREHRAQLIVPTGALIGLDAVTAAAEGIIHSVKMITRKPVAGLVGAPYLVENGIRIEGIREPLRLFSGSAREGARGFPANLNVAVALSLAGIGPDRTQLEIWADPSHRGRSRLGQLQHVDREHSVGESAHRAHHRTVGDRGATQAAQPAARGNVTR